MSALLLCLAACSARPPDIGTATGTDVAPDDRTAGGGSARTCVRDHDRCGEDADCCNAFCMRTGDESFCQSREPECVEGRGVCNADRDCCGLSCVNHRCDAAVCAPLHARCSGTGRPCCEGTCIVAEEGTRTCERLDLGSDEDAGGAATPFVTADPSNAGVAR